MSGASASQNSSTAKATVSATSNQTPALPSANPPAQLEEDDEFEDFPVEDWGDEDTDASVNAASAPAPTHLWEESWDDDDTSEDFAQMLREELKKVNAGKR